MFEQKIDKRRRKNHSEARLAAIVDSSFDAIISKDLSGTIVSWNKAAERLFGFTAAQAIGRSIYILIPEDRHDEEVEIIRRIKLGEQIETFETLRNTRAGALVPVSITISPIRDKRGRIIGASKIARDISESKESERRLKLLMREINHRVKNQYAVILSVIAQTAARELDIKAFERRVRERIMALSHSQDLLSSVDWAGVDLKALISHQVRPIDTSGAFSCSGPEILLDANAVLNIGMALHELVINRVQFSGAELSDVELSWTVAGEPEREQFKLIWRETGVREPDLLARGNGFGSLVLKRIVAAALGGTSTWNATEDAIIWTLIAPLPRIQIGIE
ncbi:PAS sensor protein (fragment) [Agrobacterium tumefaciens str. Kerr 14]|uniref:Blue-light-activated histidine kinase n=1 Tax=Agrobacterium tumefaciens str. Kerr 14 TaxID=1183424 RepID=A0A1S7SF76_AGRTU